MHILVIHVRGFLPRIHSVIHLRVLSEVGLSLSLKPHFVDQITALKRLLFLFSQLIVQLGSYSYQIRCAEWRILSLDLRDHLLDKKIVCAFCLFGSIFIFKSSFEFLIAFNFPGKLFIIPPRLFELIIFCLSRTIILFLLWHIIIKIFSRLVLIKQLMNFHLTDCLVLDFLFLLDSFWQLLESQSLLKWGLDKGWWRRGAFDCGFELLGKGEFEHGVDAHDLAVLWLWPEAIVKWEHDIGNLVR